MNAAQLLNPLGTLMDLGAKLAGLPPEVASAAKIVAGAASSNYLMAADGALQLADRFVKFPSPAPEYLPSSQRGTQSSGYAASGTRDPLAALRLEALRTLRKNFDAAEVAGAFLKFEDGRLGLEDLHSLVKDPKTGADLKRAAQFLLDHPQEYAAIAKTRGPIPVDVWYIAQSDIDEAVESAQAARDRDSRPTPGGPARPTTPRSPPSRPTPSGGGCDGGSGGGGSSGSTSGGGRIRDILNDPNLSTEEKLRAILWSVMENLDDEMLLLGADMDDVTEQRKGLKPDEQDKSQELQRSLEKMSDRFQTLVQRRQAMFELLSNLTLKQGEMAMRAVSNLGR